VKSVSIYDRTQFSLFVQEIKLLSLLKHPNVLEFFGVMLHHGDDGGMIGPSVFLVTELMDLDLKAALKVLTFEQRLEVAKDISKAMSFLHDQKPPVLHRDLKPSNVLISKDGRVKVADFGLSRLISFDTMTKQVGTLTYMAPEVCATGKYNEKADVYSFGVMMAELMAPAGSNFNPFEHLEAPEIIFAKILVTGKAKLQFHNTCPAALTNLFQQCVDFESLNRPSFDQILGELRLFEKTGRFRNIELAPMSMSDANVDDA